ncbi:B125R [African swine fever virus]|uniref:Uncharacterized protein B125R n=7 Tax=African swine fever virus TaxID=10497 RepID=VF125_ASFB7|nr:pB125R [African swine fever virus]YP_009702330.1 pB125R [African swine fever virus]YP_009702488.1 pB125R [African swine fever virus]YP_009702649.1 pB125R [African swine fever virus]YP_009703139.1 B125R [African swine fever virus]YP_009703336.1 pB125R [African swine fever virus]YP_009703535.1 pB125R [African swine fever virus Benin 97/1]YP_009703690.1 pB125R [African swine fever virus OURT 88/3]YP_009703852.1 hypothetical protein F8224_gp090 [African swine fever virus E75]YP_009927207.1 
MAVYAKDLDNNKELNQKLINDQLKIIDTLLLAEKKNFLVYELPAPFDFSSGDPLASQRDIYYAIIKSLEERGFTVKICMKGDRALLFITWKKIQSIEINKKEEYLRMHFIQDEEKAFYCKFLESR